MTVDERFRTILNGSNHVFELSRMSLVTDRRWIGGTATGFRFSSHTFFQCRVGLRWFGEVPYLDVFFLQYGGPFRTIKLDLF